MKEFRVIESIPSSRYYEYIVTAENEEQALQEVKKGNKSPVDSWDEVDDSADSNFNVWDASIM